MADAKLDLYSIKFKDHKDGDKREVTRRFEKGRVLSFKNHEDKWKLTQAIEMEVIETFQDGDWFLASYKTDTTRPAPSRWTRLKSWLTYPKSNLPTAKVIK